jgi:hypothetical protein
LDVERGERFGLKVFGQLIQAASQFGQFVKQVDVIGAAGPGRAGQGGAPYV